MRLKKLLSDLEQFIEQLEKSERRAVLVFLPEHGAALRGDLGQPAGLRDTPSPAITTVPVGIRLIGPGMQRHGDQVKLEQPSSYLTISELIESMLKKSPYSDKGFVPQDYVSNLTLISPVAENEHTIVMQYHGLTYAGNQNEGWKAYPTARNSSKP
jgi:hypothetical protein